MKIAIVGYGKMGHIIENSAKNFGHEVVATVDIIAKDATNLVPQGDYDAVAKAVKESGAEGVEDYHAVAHKGETARGRAVEVKCQQSRYAHGAARKFARGEAV